MEEELIAAFEVFQIELESGSTLLDRLRDLAVQHGMTAEELSEEWVAYASNGSRELTEASCDEWGTRLAASKGKRGVGKKQLTVAERKVHTKNDLVELFEDDLIGQYGDLGGEGFATQLQCGVKRSVQETTPPSSTHKVRITENGATPTTPLSSRRPHSVNNHSEHNGLTPTTPAGSYTQRKNSGAVACSLNERGIPTSRGRGKRGEVKVLHYDLDLALTAPYHHVFQKISDKALALLEWAEELGGAICHTHSLSEPLPLSLPSLEPAVYVGRVLCDGEGHLNPSSVLLEGSLRPGTPLSHRVRLEIPSSALPCSLFPGQVVAVEGVNNFSGTLVANVIHDQGVFPPLPKRSQDTIGGFSAVVAAGPLTTCDLLDMTPLHDLIAMVTREGPDILLLMGPFLDVNNTVVKTGSLPEDLTLQQFFTHRILQPLVDCVSGQRTQLLLIPSQRDAHHPFEVYPQPPFQTSTNKQERGRVHYLSDPCTLSVNGVCIGATSTDTLFHLSARTMFLGPSGDRMGRLAGHILKQQSYYPLVPPYRREEPHPQIKAESADNEPRPPSEACEINLDYIQAFEERRGTLPARPDLLILPSDLKPFIKVLEGCVCINPGHLTRKMSGGTFVKLVVPELPAKPDLSSDVAVTVVHI